MAESVTTTTTVDPLLTTTTPDPSNTTSALFTTTTTTTAVPATPNRSLVDVMAINRKGTYIFFICCSVLIIIALFGVLLCCCRSKKLVETESDTEESSVYSSASTPTGNRSPMLPRSDHVGSSLRLDPTGCSPAPIGLSVNGNYGALQAGGRTYKQSREEVGDENTSLGSRYGVWGESPLPSPTSCMHSDNAATTTENPLLIYDL